MIDDNQETNDYWIKVTYIYQLGLSNIDILAPELSSIGDFKGLINSNRSMRSEKIMIQNKDIFFLKNGPNAL